ncbi:hypothetical protein FF1_043567 [Malus domestica]
MRSSQSGNLHSCHLVVQSTCRILILFPDDFREESFAAWEKYLALEHQEQARNAGKVDESPAVDITFLNLSGPGRANSTSRHCPCNLRDSKQRN